MHKGDGSRRANLVIGHEGDRWWAYCQACKTGDAVHKTHVRLSERAPAESTLVDPPTDVVPWQRLDQAMQERLEGFLLSKGVNRQMLPELGYSDHRKRLIVRPTSWPVASLGRDTTGNSNVKWIVYGTRGKAWVTEPLPDGVNARGTLYLTEDLFSMYKLRWALIHYMKAPGTWVGTTLGTGITSHMLAALIRANYQRIVVFYDGDRAGESGSKTVAHRLRAVMPSTEVLGLTAPTGYDPKDLFYEDIINHLQLWGGLPT